MDDDIFSSDVESLIRFKYTDKITTIDVVEDTITLSHEPKLEDKDIRNLTWKLTNYVLFSSRKWYELNIYKIEVLMDKVLITISYKPVKLTYLQNVGTDILGLIISYQTNRRDLLNLCKSLGNMIDEVSWKLLIKSDYPTIYI